MKFLALTYFLSISLWAAAQTKVVTIRFMPTYAHKPLQLYVYYHLPGGDSVMIETLRFYISEIELYSGGAMVYKEQNSTHLIDASELKSMALAVQMPAALQYNSIHFNLGLDSIINTSGALGGDLDPANGMYWAWQSGYINCKLEGKSNRCPARKNEFHFHLGGYLSPYSALQHVAINTSGKNDIVIEVPVDRFLSQIDLSRQHSVMIPGAEAVLLSEALIKVFLLTTP